MIHDTHDLIVIGSGGAGSTAATTAAGMGKRVALIERDKLGGTCLNYGCDPTKTLLNTAHLFFHARGSPPRVSICIWARRNSRPPMRFG